ncbi:MAG: hypothetical protein JNK42_00030 [Caedimonas sp.]|nr:hypothetical protein [Caedimonas sp.]
MTGMQGAEKTTTMDVFFLPFGGAIDPKKTEKCSDNQILDNQTYLNLKTVLKKPSGV